MRRILTALGAAVLAQCILPAGAAAAGAEEGKPAPPQATVKELATREVAGASGKEVRLLTVEYIPGGASLAHRHNAQVFVYVLSGRVKMQVAGGPLLTLGPGETFYEGPDDVHTVSANASATKPARILVFMIKDVGAPVTVPASAANTGQDLAQTAGRPLIGKPAPSRTVKTIDGETIDLGSLYGKKAVYLKFWATWCVPCRQQMPHFQQAFETAGPDMAVIAINTGFNDSVDAVQTYRKQLGITMPIVMDDGTLAAAFGLRVTPQHIVIGRDGRILYVGHLADAQLDAALAAARAEPAAAVAQSTSRPALHRYGVGDRIPDLAPRTLDGERFQFRGADQRPMVLVFLSPWCESYLAESRPAAAEKCRRMREQTSELGSANGVRLLGIAAGLWATPEDLRDYKSKYGVTMPLTLDASGDLFREFAVSEVPLALMIDRHGRIVGKVDAADTEKPAALREAVAAL